MEPLFVNKTNLTLDMYKDGVAIGYKSSHRFVRVVSTAYAFVMGFLAVGLFLNYNFLQSGIFAFLTIVIILWNIFGYKIGTKKSFMKFAKLHDSHFQVEMEFRFYEDRLEQETSKTEMAVMYKDIDVVYYNDEYILIMFDRKLILMNQFNFIDESAENVINFLREKSLKVKKSTY